MSVVIRLDEVKNIVNVFGRQNNMGIGADAAVFDPFYCITERYGQSGMYNRFALDLVVIFSFREDLPTSLSHKFGSKYERMTGIYAAA
jgi:hypothetical protein